MCACPWKYSLRDQQWLPAAKYQAEWYCLYWKIQLIQREGGTERCAKPLTPATDVAGRYRGKGNDHPVGRRYAEILDRIMQADFAVIETAYDRACHLELPGGLSRHGRGAADEFWMGLRAAFPHATKCRTSPPCP